MSRTLACLAVALAVAPVEPAAAETPAAAVTHLYVPYRGPADPRAAWERPVWSARTRALTAAWRRVVPQDELDDLNDSDWLCQCQDWDEKAFRPVLRSLKPAGPSRVMASVDLTIAPGAVRPQRIELVREHGRSLVDDLFSRDYPRGLRAALIATTRADRKLHRRS